MVVFHKGFYAYKNETNDNGRIIYIEKITDCTMRYSIFNYRA